MLQNHTADRGAVQNRPWKAQRKASNTNTKNLPGMVCGTKYLR